MSIIKCPECRKQVSTMAGTCPHCNTKISGQLRTCPCCGGYCLVTQEECPECKNPLHIPTDSPVEGEDKDCKVTSSQSGREKVVGQKKKSKKASLWGCLAGIICLVLLGIGCYYYYQQWQQEKEQTAYERLEGITNPEFYQQFLNDYPESEHCEEIHERMLVLQVETEEWEQLQKGINRKTVSRFMQKYPDSFRLRLCEDMLDSIDWQNALAVNTEEAITNYLTNHPSGRYVTEAAEKKNALLLARVTPEERAMIRNTLESFFSKAIANQDIESAREAIPDTTMIFCDNQKADAEAIVQYAREKIEKDVIGLHYLIGEKMEVHRETLPDGNTGFSVNFGLQETISRSDTNQPASNQYRVTALLNQEQKIVRMNIVK